jgi:Na+/glutamate symporter
MVGTLVGFIAATSWVLLLAAVGVFAAFIVSTVIADRSIREVSRTPTWEGAKTKLGRRRKQNRKRTVNKSAKPGDCQPLLSSPPHHSFPLTPNALPPPLRSAASPTTPSPP